MNIYRLKRLQSLIPLFILIIAFTKIVFQLKFWIVPVFFFLVGFCGTLWHKRNSLYLFFVLFPFINASPGFFDASYAFNKIAPPLFLLSGMLTVYLYESLFRPGITLLIDEENHQPFKYYYLFLLFLFISVIFVFFRWSNLGLPTYDALCADTQVSPGTRAQRISYASIFPVVSLFIYFISPYIYGLIKKFKTEEKTVFNLISYGFFISAGMGLYQLISGVSLISDRLGKDLKQYYGGFSDFNAFGFFSGVMFLWSTYQIKKKNNLGFIVLIVSLGGGILSGSRAFFFFLIAGILHLFLDFKRMDRKKKKILTVMLMVVILLVILLGGTLTKRLSEGFDNADGWFEKLNSITNGRLWMTLFSLQTIKDNFFSGVGTGNFTFYLDYKNYGHEYLYDLTLNHYLLIFTENGLFAFLFFTGFLWLIFYRSQKKLLIGMILFSLLFNNFFWFPEGILLFWIILALDSGMSQAPVERKEESQIENHPKSQIYLKYKKYRKPLLIISLALFILFNILQFNHLHPQTWALKTGEPYNYGFWYVETDPMGKTFRWTMETAGELITLDDKGQSGEITLDCGAPLVHLPHKTQTIRIYWQGKLYKEFRFAENRKETFKIEAEPNSHGFLEVEAVPAFNLEKMGLGLETRDLGVKFYY